MFVASEQELFRACQVLFGGGLALSRDFLNYLQPSGVKRAYRERVFATHPDRSAIIGAHGRPGCATEFISVQEAYQQLSTFLENRDLGRVTFAARPAGRSFRRRPDSSPAAAGNGSPRRTAGFRRNCAGNRKADTRCFRHPGPVPARKLLFGHYLYYSGLIDWRTIINALVWQKANRPRLGELGVRKGLLARQSVEHILRNRERLELFGEAALKMGLLSAAQLDRLLVRQRFMQRKIGEFFVEKQIFSPLELSELLSGHFQHNLSNSGKNSRGKSPFR